MTWITFTSVEATMPLVPRKYGPLPRLLGFGETNIAQAEIDLSEVTLTGVPAVVTVTMEDTGLMAHLRSKELASEAV